MSAGGPAPITVRRVSRIGDIGPETWHRLAAGHGLYLGYSWLAWAEQDRDYTTTYLVAAGESGIPEAALVTYLWRGGVGLSMNQAYDPLHLLVEPRQGTVSGPERDAWLPILLLGSRAGYHGGMVIDPGVDTARRAQLVNALLTAARSLADELAARSVALLYAPEKHAAEVLAQASADGMAPSAAPLSAEAVIPLEPAGTPPETLPVSHRQQLEQRRETRIFADGGSVISRARLSECYEVMGPLLGRLQRKYGTNDTDAAFTGYLKRQAAFLDHCSHVLLEERDGEVVGGAFGYEWDSTLYIRGAGFGPRSGRYAYFNLVFYAAAELAAERGLTEMDLGTGAYRGKLLRGAVPRPTWSIVWPPEGTSVTWRAALCAPGEDYLAAVGTAHQTRAHQTG